MTDPQRLVNGAGDDLTAALLRSAERDAPDPRAVQRAMMALGVGGAVGAGVLGASAAATATSSGAVLSSDLLAKASVPPAAAAVASASGIGLLVKWVGIAMVGGLTAWGMTRALGSDLEQAVVVDTPAAPEVPAPAPTPAEPIEAAPEAVAHDEPARAPEEAAPEDAAPTNAVPKKAAPHADVSPAPRATPEPAGSLGDEVAALDAARQRVNDDPAAALAAIEAYQAKFGAGGVLAQEAEVLRIESLARSGKTDQARARGNAFLARHPSSPAAQRVRSLLATL